MDFCKLQKYTVQLALFSGVFMKKILFMLMILASFSAFAGGSIFHHKSRSRNANGVNSIGAYVCGSLQCHDVVIKEGSCNGMEHATMQYGVCMCDEGYKLEDGKCLVFEDGAFVNEMARVNSTLESLETYENLRPKNSKDEAQYDHLLQILKKIKNFSGRVKTLSSDLSEENIKKIHQIKTDFERENYPLQIFKILGWDKFIEIKDSSQISYLGIIKEFLGIKSAYAGVTFPDLSLNRDAAADALSLCAQNALSSSTLGLSVVADLGLQSLARMSGFDPQSCSVGRMSDTLSRCAVNVVYDTGNMISGALSIVVQPVFTGVINLLPEGCFEPDSYDCPEDRLIKAGSNTGLGSYVCCPEDTKAARYLLSDTKPICCASNMVEDSASGRICKCPSNQVTLPEGAPLSRCCDTQNVRTKGDGTKVCACPDDRLIGDLNSSYVCCPEGEKKYGKSCCAPNDKDCICKADSTNELCDTCPDGGELKYIMGMKICCKDEYLLLDGAYDTVYPSFCGCPNGGKFKETDSIGVCCKDGYAWYNSQRNSHNGKKTEGGYTKPEVLNCGCLNGGVPSQLSPGLCCKDGYTDNGTGVYNLIYPENCGCPSGYEEKKSGGERICCKDGKEVVFVNGDHNELITNSLCGCSGDDCCKDISKPGTGCDYECQKDGDTYKWVKTNSVCCEDDTECTGSTCDLTLHICKECTDGEELVLGECCPKSKVCHYYPGESYDFLGCSDNAVLEGEVRKCCMSGRKACTESNECVLENECCPNPNPIYDRDGGYDLTECTDVSTNTWQLKSGYRRCGSSNLAVSNNDGYEYHCCDDSECSVAVSSCESFFADSIIGMKPGDCDYKCNDKGICELINL